MRRSGERSKTQRDESEKCGWWETDQRERDAMPAREREIRDDEEKRSETERGKIRERG